MDLATKAELLQLISISRRQQELSFDTLADAAILAAEQVQDTRLRFQESEKSLWATDDLFQILVSLAFQAVASSILKKAMGSLLEPLLSLRDPEAGLPRLDAVEGEVGRGQPSARLELR